MTDTPGASTPGASTPGTSTPGTSVPIGDLPGSGTPGTGTPGGRGDRSGGPFAAQRAAVRARPGGALLLKAIALLIGGAFVALGGVLIVLPGPLTIPPVLVGLYVLSLEFAWADRLLQKARKSASQTWEQAKRKPVTSGLITGGGLVVAGVVIWAVVHYDLVARAKDAIGL